MHKQSLLPPQKQGTTGSKTTVLADLTGKKVIYKTFIAGDKMNPHTAPVDLFVLLLDGQIDISLSSTSPGDASPGAETSRFVASDNVVIPANTVHALTCVEAARLLIYR